MSKKILFIAPSSFPVNSPEAIVNIKLLELLSSNDYQIDLISKKIKWSNYPSTQSLEDLDVKINRNIVVEVDNKLTLKTLFQHLCIYFLFGTVFKGAHWAYEVIFNNRSFFKDEKYDYVITKDTPSFLIGYYLKKKYGLKWISTWNDPYPPLKYPVPYGSGLNAKMPFYNKGTIRIMDFADKHIFPNERLRNYMLNYLDPDKTKTIIIPHLAYEPILGKTKNEKKLRLIHSGNVRSPRDPKIVVQAFAKFIADTNANDIDLDFIGIFDNELIELVKSVDCESQINLLPPVEYKQSLELLKEYDLALIIEAPCEEGIFLPTKVGDYMSHKTPIFSISPSIGVLNDLYVENYVQYFADISNEDDIYEEFKKIYSDYKSDQLKNSRFNDTYGKEYILKLYNTL
jgi:glycosyltransferase involved in cell wall biosynthesis